MLNEMLEANEYMYDLDKSGDKSNRIVLSAFLKSKKGEKPPLSGIDRAMTMVARRFLFPDDKDDIKDISADELNERIYRAAASLRMWCGLVPLSFNNPNVKDAYEELSSDGYHHIIQDWLPRYIKKAAENGEITSENENSALEKLKSRKKPYACPVFILSDAENDYRAPKYDKIIANALIAYGPLREYCLVCEDSSWYENIKKNNNKKINEDKKNRDGDKDKILKITAAYLLERRRKKREYTSVSYEPTNFKVLSFWIGRVMDGDKIKKFTYNGEPLFETRKVGEKHVAKDNDSDEAKDRGNKGPGNTTKIKPNVEWFTKCGWDIIDITDSKKPLTDYLANHPGAIYYTDNGGGSDNFLTLHKQEKNDNDTAK